MAKQPQITIVKFKRGTATYALPVDNKAVDNEKTMKGLLVDAINGSGGLTLVETGDMVAEDDTNVISEVSADDLRLAVPKDKLAPYANVWTDFSDAGEWKDYDIVAFAYQEEPFEVVEAKYDEEE